MKNGTLCSNAAELYSKYLCALHAPFVSWFTPQWWVGEKKLLKLQWRILEVSFNVNTISSFLFLGISFFSLWS